MEHFSASLSRPADWQAIVTHRMRSGSIEAPDDRPFRVAVRMIEADGVQLWDIDSSPQVFRRIGDAPGRGPSVVALVMQLAGRSTSGTGGGRHLLEPDDVTILDWTRPQERRFDEDSRSVVLRVPSDALGIAVPRDAHGPSAARSARSSIGPVLSGTIRGLLECWPSPGDCREERYAHETMRFLVRVLAAMLEQEPVRPPDVGDDELSRAKAYIREHLGDPALSPRQVASAVYVSLRRLYTLFDTEPEGVSAWIRAERLDRIRDDLRDASSDGALVREIGERWGITNPGSLSRAYVRRFGVTPAEERRGN